MSWLTRLIYPTQAAGLKPQQLEAEAEPTDPTDPAKRVIDAACAGDTEQVRLLLAQGRTFAPDRLGKALNLSGVESLTVEMATLLLDAGADVNFKEEFYGATTLHWVVGRSEIDLDLVRLLVARGADPTLTTHSGNCPLKEARDKGSQELFDELDRAKPGVVASNTLIIAAKYGAPGLARLAIEAGVDGNSNAEKDPPKGQFSAMPAIILAAEGGHAEVVQLLLEHGVSPDTTGDGGWNTALTAAIESRDGASVRLLLDAGADPNLQRASGVTPLQVAEWAVRDTGCDTEIVDLIKEAGGVGIIFEPATDISEAVGAQAEWAQVISGETIEQAKWVWIFMQEIENFLTKPQTRDYERRTDAWWTEDNLKLVIAKEHLGELGERLYPLAEKAIDLLVKEGKIIGTPSAYRAP